MSRKLFLLLCALSVPARAQASDCVTRYPTPETTAQMFDAAQELRRSNKGAEQRGQSKFPIQKIFTLAPLRAQHKTQNDWSQLRSNR